MASKMCPRCERRMDEPYMPKGDGTICDVCVIAERIGEPWPLYSQENQCQASDD